MFHYPLFGSNTDILTECLVVTVIGQSVGASDIGLQLTAFGGHQNIPFQKAV